MTSVLLKQKTEVTNLRISTEIDKLGTQLKVVLQTAGRVSAAAESYGGLQIECRIRKSISGVMEHISENLRFNFEKNKGKFDMFLGHVTLFRSSFSERLNIFLMDLFQTFVSTSASLRSFTASAGRLVTSMGESRRRGRAPSLATTAPLPS